VTNWRLTLEYQGEAFSGWQRQAAVRTVQQVVEEALAVVFDEPRVVVHASGRTDAGVHALGQVISFRTPTEREPERVRLALNALLPRDVSCLAAEHAPPEFHARFSALGKTYRYLVLDRRDRSPFWAGRAFHSRRPLDWEAIAAALPHFAGTHDFTSFHGHHVKERDPVKTITAATHSREDELHALTFSGSGFLRFQVRIMVGTLLEIGQGRRAPDSVPGLLEARDRRLAGRTAHPDGLYLVAVRY